MPAEKTSNEQMLYWPQTALWAIEPSKQANTLWQHMKEQYWPVAPVEPPVVLNVGLPKIVREEIARRVLTEKSEDEWDDV